MPIIDAVAVADPIAALGAEAPKRRLNEARRNGQVGSMHSYVIQGRWFS